MELLKGKTFHTPINTNSPIERVSLPPLIQETHPSDNLDIDFLYCQGAPYLLIKSTTIKFQAIQTFNRISKSQKKGVRRVTYKRGPSDIIKGAEKVT